MGDLGDLLNAMPDAADRAAEFTKRHRHVLIAASRGEWQAAWVEACAGPRDGEPICECREDLGDLMDHLEAKFDRKER